MVAIIAGTPYQLINALNYIKSQKKECVLFIRFIERKTKRLAGNFDITKINEEFIKDIYYFDVTSLKKMGTINRVFFKILYGSKSKIKHYIPELNLKYKFDEILLPKWETFYDAFKPFFTEDVKYYVLEDGIGDYIYDVLEKNTGNKVYVKEKYDRCMVCPDMYNDGTDVLIHKMPKLKKETMPKSLPEFFRWNQIENKFNKFIYFTQMFDALPIQTECPRVEKELYDILEDTVEEDNITVKLHPRSEANAYGKNGIVSLTPWELISALSDDIEDKVLVSMCSGSVFFTKLLCDKEPYVICLVKIYAPYIYHKDGSDDEEKTRTFDFINGVKNSYKNKNKFFIPETIDEYKQILNDIKQGKL